MKRTVLVLTAALAAATASTPAFAGLPADDEKVVARGLDALYRSDYDEADSIFAHAVSDKPGDPALSLGSAVAAWWRMENEFAAPGSAVEQRFMDSIARAIDDAERATAKGGDGEAYVCLGAAYGLRGRLEAARKQWFKAYRDGRKAYRYEQEALKLDPQLYDAYLGLGAFDYYTATLSRFIRFFTFAKGDKAKGLMELELATKGEFGGMAAKLLLVGIDWTFEKNPRRAWTRLEEASRAYPDSPLFESMRLIGLFHLRDAEGLMRDARAYLRKAKAGAPRYRPVDVAAGHYFLGLGQQLAGLYEEAIAQDETALRLLPPGHRARALPHLFIGECLDVLDRREEALVAYRQALKDPPFWGVQRYAKFLVKRPFKAGDNPLPGRADELD